MKNIFYILIGLFIYNIANAQIETTNWNYQLDNNKTEQFQIKYQTKTISLKTENLYRFRNEEFLLGLTLKKAIEEGNLTVYRDKNCQNSITIEEVKTKMTSTFMDTLLTFDPFTFEEVLKVVETKIIRFPIKETIYELEQKWNLKAKTTQSIMTLEAIHISHYELVDNLNTEKKHYLFSIKGEDLESLITASNLESQSVTWAKYIEYEGSFENDEIKENLFTKQYLLDHKIVSSLIDNHPYSENLILTKSEIETIGISIDTIITYDPETFKEEVTVKQTVFDLNDIKFFKIAQELYFDTQDYTFKNRLLAIAPMREVYDDNGNYKYEQQMFWIVYHDDFLKWLD
jgi:hypothetical protein